MHFERRNAFQNAYNYIFPEKKIIKKNMCAYPNLKFSDGPGLSRPFLGMGLGPMEFGKLAVF